MVGAPRLTALLEAGVLLGADEHVLPAKHRWNSMSACAAQVSCGILVHGALPRAFQLAFGQVPGQRQGEDESDYKAALRQKARRSVQFLGAGDPGRSLQGKQQEVLVATFVGEPLEWLQQE